MLNKLLKLLRLLKYNKSEDFWQEVRNWSKKDWEISMHGYNHVYGTQTYKKDYFI